MTRSRRDDGDDAIRELERHAELLPGMDQPPGKVHDIMIRPVVDWIRRFRYEIPDGAASARRHVDEADALLRGERDADGMFAKKARQELDAARHELDVWLSEGGGE